MLSYNITHNSRVGTASGTFGRDSVLQSAACMISFTVTPAPAVAEVDDLRKGTSTPANLQISFNQQTIEHDATGLWSFLMAMKSPQKSDCLILS